MLRLRTFALLTASTLVVTLPVAIRPALAGPPAGRPVSAAAPDDTTDPYRRLVRRFADLDPRWEVQTAAWSALVSDAPTAVTDFLSTGGGLTTARTRATQNAARNDLVISRTLATTTDKTAPIVHLTALRASYATLAEKDRYVRTGLAEAQALDARHSPVEQAKQQAQADRDYVTDIAAHGSGAWVRAAAQRAIKKSTDADIAEFFKYAWASAAACDLQAYRMNLLDQDVVYRHRLEQLITLADDARRAYEEATGAARAKAAEEAKAAWNTAADTAAATQAAWSANQESAAAQARSWTAVHDFAVTASTQQNWPAIAGQADVTGGAWTAEVTWAQGQAQEWAAQYESAKKQAELIPDPTATPTPTETP